MHVRLPDEQMAGVHPPHTMVSLFEVAISYLATRTYTVYLVGGWPTPLKNMSSSVGMIIPNIWKNIPNHQPDHHHIPIVVGFYPINHY